MIKLYKDSDGDRWISFDDGRHVCSVGDEQHFEDVNRRYILKPVSTFIEPPPDPADEAWAEAEARTEGGA